MTSAAEAVARARAHVVTRQTPQGMCLNWVWRMFGAQNSTGYAQGTLSTAYNAWLGSKHKRGPEVPIPIGAPVYFGISPTRTDKNKNAGDVMIHVGGGILAGTDVNGANTGYITIAARARQIQRPFLGHTLDFGGRDINFGVALAPAGGGQTVIVPTNPQEDKVHFITSTAGAGYALINGRFTSFDTAEHQDLFKRVATDTRTQFTPGEIDVMNSYLERAYKASAREFWDYLLPGYNGPQSARARLAGIDEKSNTLSQAERDTLIKALVAGIGKGITVPPVEVEVDYEVLASKVADKLAERLAT